MLAEGFSAWASYVDLTETSCHGIVAGSTDDDVELMLFRRSLDAVLCDLFDGAFVDINKADVRLIENLEKALLQRDPFTTKSVLEDWRLVLIASRRGKRVWTKGM